MATTISSRSVWTIKARTHRTSSCPNPNKREGGWVNASVDFVGENGTGSKKNGWLVYNNDNASAGVGGYTPQLRFALKPDDG